MYKKTITIILTYSILCIFLTSCTQRADIPAPNSSSEAAIPVSTLPKNETIKLVAVGDNLIHDAIYMQAAARTTAGAFDFTPAYEKIEDYIKDADIAMINQETPLASKIAPLSNYPLFNSPTAVGDHLMKMGFDVINHANNHIYDKGAKGVLATLDYWDTQKNATVVGVHRDNDDKNKIDYLEKGNIKLAFLGYTDSTNGIMLTSGSAVGTTMLQETELVKAQIKEAKKNADIVVLSLHWGVENSNIPHPTQRSLASDLIEAGADIIIGHHSHVLQEGEFITRSDGTKGYVMYSLGNFISAQREINNLAGGILQLEITKDNEQNKTEITALSFVPTVTHYGMNVRQVTIYPFSEYTPELAKAHGVQLYRQGFSYEFLEKQLEPIIRSATFG